MSWGIFKKIGQAIKKAAQWTNNKIFKPVISTVKKVVTPDNIKKVVDTGTKLAPMIGAGVSTAMGGNPMSGMKVGHVVQGLGNNLGFGY